MLDVVEKQLTRLATSPAVPPGPAITDAMKRPGCRKAVEHVAKATGVEASLLALLAGVSFNDGAGHACERYIPTIEDHREREDLLRRMVDDLVSMVTEGHQGVAVYARELKRLGFGRRQ